MITKTYICDSCKKSVGEKELIEVSTTLNIPCHHYRKNLNVKKDICISCLKAKGIYVPDENKDQIEEDISIKNEKKLKDTLIDLLQQLDVSFNDHEHY